MVPKWDSPEHAQLPEKAQFVGSAPPGLEGVGEE